MITGNRPSDENLRSQTERADKRRPDDVNPPGIPRAGQSRRRIPVIQEANAAAIPVLTVKIPCNEPGVKIAMQIGTDNYGGGTQAGAAMIEALGEAGGEAEVLHFKQAEPAAREEISRSDRRDAQPEGKHVIKDGKPALYADAIVGGYACRRSRGIGPRKVPARCFASDAMRDGETRMGMCSDWNIL